MTSLIKTIHAMAQKPALQEADHFSRQLTEAAKGDTVAYNEKEAIQAHARAQHLGSGTPEYHENMMDHFTHLAAVASLKQKEADKKKDPHAAEYHAEQARKALASVRDHSYYVKEEISEGEELNEEEFHHRLHGDESHRKMMAGIVKKNAKASLEAGLIRSNKQDEALESIIGGRSTASKARAKMKITDKHVDSFLGSRHGHHIADAVNLNINHQDETKKRAHDWIKTFDHRTHMHESTDLQEGVLNESTRHEREAILHHAKAQFAKREGDTEGHHRAMADHHLSMQDHHMSEWKAADAKKDTGATAYHMKQANHHSEQMDHHHDSAARHAYRHSGNAFESFDEDSHPDIELVEAHATHHSATARLERLNEKHPHTIHHISQGRRTGRYFVVRHTESGSHIVESVQQIDEVKIHHVPSDRFNSHGPNSKATAFVPSVHDKHVKIAKDHLTTSGFKETGTTEKAGKTITTYSHPKHGNLTLTHGKAGNEYVTHLHEGDESEKDFQDYMKSRQKPKMDPVGKEDADVNNDGKKNNADKFIKNRRATIAKAIAKEKK